MKKFISILIAAAFAVSAGSALAAAHTGAPVKADDKKAAAAPAKADDKKAAPAKADAKKAAPAKADDKKAADKKAAPAKDIK